jgi:hypothetical protein
LPDIIEMMKRRRIRWRGLITCMGAKEMHRKFWYENLKEKENYGKIVVCVKEIEWKSVGGIHVVHKYQSPVYVTTVMNVQIS